MKFEFPKKKNEEEYAPFAFKEFFDNNKEFVLITLGWGLSGFYLRGLAAPLVLGCLFLYRFRKRYAEMFFGFFVVLYLSDSHNYGFSWAQSVKPLYIFIMGGFYFISKDDFPKFNKFFVPFVPFFILAVMIVPRSETIGVCFQKTISYILLFFLVPNFISKLYEDYGEVFFKNLVLVLTSVIIVALLMRFAGSPLVIDERFKGFMGNPNAMGLYCSTFFILLIVILQYFPNLFTRLELLIIYGSIALAVYLCNSRNSIFTIAMFLFFRRFYAISPLFGFIIFLIVSLSYEYVFNHLNEIVQGLGLSQFLRVESLSTGSGRTVAWEFGWEQVQQNFYFGKGFAYEEYIYYKGDNQEKLNLLGHVGAAHNSPLAMWLNTGFFGVVLYYFALLAVFLKASKFSMIAFPVMFGYLFSSYFESWLVGSLNPYTILLIIAATILTSDEFNKEPQTDIVPLL